MHKPPARPPTMKWCGELLGDSAMDTLVVACAEGVADGALANALPLCACWPCSCGALAGVEFCSLPQPTLLWMMRCRTCVWGAAGGGEGGGGVRQQRVGVPGSSASRGHLQHSNGA